MSNGVQIQYWAGIYTDRSLKNILTTEHKEALAECFSSTKQVRFEKLKRYSNVYSIRYGEGRAHRLLLTIIDGKLVVLADLPNHQYKTKLKSLKKLLKQLSQSKIKLPSASDDDNPSEEDPSDFEEMSEAPFYIKPSVQNNNDDDDVTLNIEYQPVVFEGVGIKPNVLVLDEDQQKAIEITLPAIISGAPGSGKTTVARAILSAVGHLGADEKILYITRSPDLVKQMKIEIDDLTTEEIKEKIEIKTYNDFICNTNDNTAKKVLTAQEATYQVKEWLQDYVKQSKNRSEQTKAFKDDIDNVYQEFRIRSGLSEADYLNFTKVGSKQSLYETKSQREWINKAYQAFIRYLSGQKFVIADYTNIPKQAKKYHTVLVDEVQDFSNQQTLSISNELTEGNQVCFFYGDGQSLEDDMPSKLFIESLFAAPLSVQTATLSQHYRCPEEVMSVARWVNDLRIQRTPDNKKKEEPIRSKTDPNQKKGGVKWVGKETANAELKALQDLVLNPTTGKHNPDICIIAHPDKLAEAQKLFNAASWQVRSTESAKGLQFPIAIIHEPLSDDKFREIDTAMEAEKIKDSSFSSPLSQLFVSITRATQDVIFYSTIHRKNLEKGLKEAILLTKSNVQMNAFGSISLEDYEKLALSLLRREGEWENGIAILIGELHYDTQAINNFIKRYKLTAPNSHEQVVTSASATSTSSKVPSKPNSNKPVDLVGIVADLTNGNSKKLIKAVKEGLDANTLITTGVFKGCSLLYVVSSKGDTAAIKVLLGAGAEVNHLQGEGRYIGESALRAALRISDKAHVETVNALIEGGASLETLPHLQDRLGQPTYTSYGKTFSPILGLVKLCENCAYQSIESLLHSPAYSGLLAAVKKDVSSKSNPHLRSFYKLINKMRWDMYSKGGEISPDIRRLVEESMPEVKADFYQVVDPYCGVTPLFKAVLDGDMALLEKLIKKGADVNELQGIGKYQGETALCAASYLGNLAAVQLLLNAKASVSLVQGEGGRFNGRSALFASVRGRSLDITALLCIHGADINEISTMGPIKGMTLLETAAKAGEYFLILPLLKLGANTALLNHRAVAKGVVKYDKAHYSEKVIEALELGDECEVKTTEFINNCIRASELTVEEKTYLLQPANLEKIHNNVRGDFLDKTNNEMVKVIVEELQELLLERAHAMGTLETPRETTTDPSTGCTALYRAASQNALPLMKMLVEDNKVSVDEEQGEGPCRHFTPLRAAAVNGHVDAVKWLLSKGADMKRLPNRQVGTGKIVITEHYNDKINALFRKMDVCESLAIKMFDIELSKYDFLKRDRSEQLKEQMRVIIVNIKLSLFEETKSEVVKAMVEGAVIQLRKEYGEAQSSKMLKSYILGLPTAQKSFLSNKDNELKTVRDRISKVLSNMTTVNIDDNVKLCQAIMIKSINDILSYTPEKALFEACLKGDIVVVNDLIKAKVDVNHLYHDKVDNKIVSPLLIASSHGHANILKALINAGADVTKEVGSGSIHAATLAYVQCAETNLPIAGVYSEILNILISAGANTSSLRNENDGKISYDKSLYNKESIEVFEHIDKCEVLAREQVAAIVETLPEKEVLFKFQKDKLIEIKNKAVGWWFTHMKPVEIKNKVKQAITALLYMDANKSIVRTFVPQFDNMIAEFINLNNPERGLFTDTLLQNALLQPKGATNSNR